MQGGASSIFLSLRKSYLIGKKREEWRREKRKGEKAMEAKKKKKRTFTGSYEGRTRDLGVAKLT